MTIEPCTSKELLAMRLIDMRCKHALKTSPRAKEMIRLSSEIGYAGAEWGSGSNHVDIRYHTDVILKMEEDHYLHPQRIVICNYEFHKEPCIWIDNLHSAVRCVRKYGFGVTFGDIPAYVVDLTGDEPAIFVNEKGSFYIDDRMAAWALDSARKRKDRSDCKALVDLNYQFWEFLADHPPLLLRKEYFGTDGMNRGAKDFGQTGTVQYTNGDLIFTVREDADDLTEENLVRLWHSVGWWNGSARMPGRLLAAVRNAKTVFIAWKDNELVGLCSAIDDGLNAWLSFLAVDSRYQNHGLGGFLLDQMRMHYAGYRIYVQTINAAKFYRRHQFIPTMVSLKLDDTEVGR